MKPTGKIGRLVRFSILTVKLGMAQASSLRFAGSPALTKWNFVRVLAMGALISAGAMMYFNLASEGAISVSTADLEQGAAPSKDVSTYRGRSIDDDEWKFDSPYYDDFRTSGEANPSYEQQRSADSIQERLEVQQVLEDMRQYYQWSSPSYEQQRAADSVQERLEVQQLLQDMKRQR